MAPSAEERCVPVKTDLDIVSARVEGRDLAKELGFGTIDQARIATAISELARNVVLYAPEGKVTVRAIISDDGERGIEVICEDNGPGIANVELVMQDGYSTSSGLGMGLPGTKRLMDEFEIETKLGVGTRVAVRRWLK
ncbi:MAG: anti-sigma regulatory factor [Anaerolineales bacterium]|nr:MAG: anti-sigma regulatory factor [Anaerolineales bacterium]